jgi:hypothetical protein
MPLHCELSIWERGGPDPGDPPNVDNMHSTSRLDYDAGTPIYIRYHTIVVPPQYLSGMITLEDHIDYSGTQIHIVNNTDSLQFADAVTDASGNFAFPAMLAACYTFTATHDSFQVFDTSFCLNSPNDSTVIDRTLLWIRYAYCGTVTLNGGAVTSGATVAVEGQPSDTTVVGGGFSIQVPYNGRSHPVHIFKARYTDAFDTVIVPLGAPCTHNYTLNLTCFGITGTVTLTGETDMSGVTLSAGGITASSHADGSFSFDSCLANGDYFLLAHKDCFVDTTVAIHVTGAGVVQNFTLVRSLVDLTGIINLPGMSDMSGTQVTVSGMAPVNTDASGHYTVSGLTCGHQYFVTITHDNFATDTTTITAPFTLNASLTPCNNVTAFRSSDSTEHVVLVWNRPTGAVDSFVITRDGVRLAMVAGGAATYTDATATFGNVYTYSIQTFYPTCESTPLATPITVHVIPATPSASILVLDFDNGLTNAGTGVSDQTVTWLQELAGAGNVLVTTQNQNLGLYGQAWLNHFSLVYVITAVNGTSSEVFDTTTASMLNNFIASPTHYMYWEGANTANDIMTSGTYAPIFQTLLTNFHINAVRGNAMGTGNVETFKGAFAFYQTHTRFDYTYRTALDDNTDVLSPNGGTAAAVGFSYVGTDTTPTTRIVKTNNTAYSSIYAAGITNTTPVYHNGRRIITPYICVWLGLGCITGIEASENAFAIVETPTLYQNEPNPFNSVTTIRFAVPTEGATRLDVFSVTGEHLSTVVDKSLNAGTYSVDWFSGDLSSGVYLYRLTTPNGVATKAMTVSK